MGVGADDEIQVFNSQAQLVQTGLDMAKHGLMTRIDQHPGGTVNKVGIAIVGTHGLPQKSMQIVGYLH